MAPVVDGIRRDTATRPNGAAAPAGLRQDAVPLGNPNPEARAASAVEQFIATLREPENRAGTAVRAPRRRAWTVAAAVACLLLTVVGVLSGLGRVGSFRVG
jgi:hypothetical protein